MCRIRSFLFEVLGRYMPSDLEMAQGLQTGDEADLL